MRGLVVVAVEQDEVALGDEVGQHDLVRRRRAVQHEIGLLRPEDRRRLLLRLQRRAFVGQEVAELQDRIVEVVAEDRLAQMLHEDAADRAAAVEDAAVVAGAGPELVALLGVVDQRAEERRLQRLGVLLEARDEVLGDEFRRLLGQEHVAVDVVEHLDRNVLEALAPDQDDDRHVEAAPAHQIDQRGRLALDALLAPVDDHAADRRVGLHRDLRVLDPARLDHLEAHPLDRRDDLVDPEALEIVGVEHRRGEEEGEALEEVHGLSPRAARGARRAFVGRMRISRIKTIVQKSKFARRRRVPFASIVALKPAISRKRHAMSLNVAPYHSRADARIHGPPNDRQASVRGEHSTFVTGPPYQHAMRTNLSVI